MDSPIRRVIDTIARRAADWWSVSAASWGGTIPTGEASRTGLAITPESALTLTAYFAAINTIATDVAMLPLKVYRRRQGGGRDEVRDHPVAVLFSGSPDGETTSMRWRQAWVGHTLGHGNGFGEIAFNGAGEPTAVYLMNPRITKACRHPRNGKLYYQTNPGTLPPRKVLHLGGFGFDGLSGYSPAVLAKEAIGLGLACEAFGSRFFGNGSHLKGVLKTPNKLSETAVKNLRESWGGLHKGLGSKESLGMAVLEHGLEWQSITIPPEDAQFLATRQFQILEIARMFRLAPHKLGDYSQSHLSNIEASNIDHLSTTIAPWCEQAEQEINRKLFTEDERQAGFYVEHDMRAFLRGDMAARGEFYLRMRDLGAMSPNEIRALENLDPVPGGDVYLVPLNMTTLEKAGESPDPPAPPDPTPNPAPTPPEPPADGTPPA